MRYLIIIIQFILFWLLVAVGYFWLVKSCPAQVSAYDPRIDGSWTTYQKYVIEGYWHPDSRQISILHRCPLSLATIVWRKLQCPSLGNNPLLAQLYFEGDASHITSDLNGPGLFDAVGSNTSGGGPYIGEVGNPLHGVTVTPGEPKLPVNPSGTEHYEIDHAIADCSGGPLINYFMHTSYYTIGWVPWWGAFQYCWLTSLEEYPGNPGNDTVYNYAFAYGKGLVDFWYGYMHDNQIGWIVNGKPTAYEYYAIAWGHM